MNHACERQAVQRRGVEVCGGLVALLVFKTSVGLNKVPGGFDSHSPPPISPAGLSFLGGRCHLIILIVILILISFPRFALRMD